MLLVGAGAREHALAWRISTSPSLTELHAAPGNPGIAAFGHCHPVRVDDGDGLLGVARAIAADLVVVGPEAPLVAGVADDLRHAGIAVFGPGIGAARIEGSKTFAKNVMAAAGIPTARPLPIAKAPCVIKADGLASGKGVFVCHTQAEVDAGVTAAAALGQRIVIEELLEGPEVSLFALCDGTRAFPLGAAQDYKRAEDGDAGPNTGGMGAYSPVAGVDVAELVERVHQPVVDVLARRGTPFVGCLFAGLMLTERGPRVLEFNARFGDPETQVLIPRIEGDLLGALAASAAGNGAETVALSEDAAVTVVLTGPDYPARSDYSGASITGIAGGRGARCACVPRRDRDARRDARDERRPHPLGHRHGRHGRGGPRARLPRCRRDQFRGRSLPNRHRRAGWLGSPEMSETVVGILVGSESDRERMKAALDELDAREIGWEFEVRSAHRNPDAVAEYAKSAADRGLRVLICGAGLAAALPGVVAAHTKLPVIGVPLRSSMSVLDGLDALLSIVQMPPGVPVATVGVDNAKNAAVLAARILGKG